MRTSDCLCTNLRQAALASTEIYNAALAPSGLKVTMFRLLRRIAEAPDITITTLAAVVGLDRSTLGRNLRVLAREDLVVLSRGRDERSRTVTLTAAGTAALDRAEPLWATAQARMAGALGPGLDQLRQTLAEIAAMHPDPERAHDAD